MVYNWVRRLEPLLFAARCRLCGVAIDGSARLCTECRAELPWLGNSCSRCALPLPSQAGQAQCGRCQRQPPAFDTTVALFHYRPPVDYLVRRLKFSAELAIAPLFAELLAERLRQQRRILPDLIMPVPLHSVRLRERGYNQATQLARYLARELDIRIDWRLCRRSRCTAPQSLLSGAARRKNLRGAFTVTAVPDAMHIAIMDDVMTTGHTGNELARTLKRAGARQVELWVIARAGG